MQAIGTSLQRARLAGYALKTVLGGNLDELLWNRL
jgi:hypothetical protein